MGLRQCLKVFVERPQFLEAAHGIEDTLDGSSTRIAWPHSSSTSSTGMVNCFDAELSASFQVMRVLPSMRNSFARCWMASTSEIVKPVMKSPRAMHGGGCQRKGSHIDGDPALDFCQDISQ
jgi:hypothetical protein